MQTGLDLINSPLSKKNKVNPDLAQWQWEKPKRKVDIQRDQSCWI